MFMWPHHCYLLTISRVKKQRKKYNPKLHSSKHMRGSLRQYILFHTFHNESIHCDEKIIVWRPERWTLHCLVTIIYCIFCKLPPHKWKSRWVSTCHPLVFFRMQDCCQDGRRVHIDYGIWHNLPHTWDKWVMLNSKIMFSSMQNLISQ